MCHVAASDKAARADKKRSGAAGAALWNAAPNVNAAARHGTARHDELVAHDYSSKQRAQRGRWGRV